MRIKIRKSDQVFSRYIRTRDNWKCQRCYKKYQEGDQGLHNSHFFGRACEATRFLGSNCDSLCFGCHQYFGANPAMYTEWKVKQMGEKQFDKLTVIAKTVRKKRDDKLDLILAQALLKELETR